MHNHNFAHISVESPDEMRFIFLRNTMEYTLCMAILTPSYYIKKDFKAGCRLIEQKLYIDAIFFFQSIS